MINFAGQERCIEARFYRIIRKTVTHKHIYMYNLLQFCNNIPTYCIPLSTFKSCMLLS